MTQKFERIALQATILICGLVPVCAGAGGAIFGVSFLADAGNPMMDSHFRYLSALLLGIGLGFWSCIPNIETKEQRARILTAIVFTGGIVRLGAALFIEWPPLPMVLAIAMELVVTPLIYIWFRRVNGRRLL